MTAVILGANGLPLGPGLSALERLGAAGPALDPLRPYASQGAPSAAALAAEFKPLAETMIAEPQGPSGSIADRLLRVADKIVTVRAVRAYGYAERDNDLLVRHGLLIRRLSIVPYARMQYVDVTAGPLERAFSLATVQLHTAAAASDARIPGLPPEEASRLRDRLTALGEDRAEGL